MGHDPRVANPQRAALSRRAAALHAPRADDPCHRLSDAGAGSWRARSCHQATIARPGRRDRSKRHRGPRSRARGQNPVPGWCANGPGRCIPSSYSKTASTTTVSAIPRSARSPPGSPVRIGPARASSASNGPRPGRPRRRPAMNEASKMRRGRALRCAVYTRKSSEEGLEQEFNSLHAQREACEAYIKSQRHEGWTCLAQHYDDGGLSGATMGRPALQQLLVDIQAGKVDAVVTYKVDRLTRSLADFAKIVEIFDARGVSFVSVTQQFNTTTSMGRLTLNVLLSFAQFEREVTGERIRDKIAASKKKGMWMGGMPPLGYDVQNRKLVVNDAEARIVVEIFRRYLALKSVHALRDELADCGIKSKRRMRPGGAEYGGQTFSRGALYLILQNRLYRGEIAHKDQHYPGEHKAIIEPQLWDAVQARLAANAVERSSGGRAKIPSLLAGLLFDGDGNRMTPTHAVKKGRRYRYYVSHPLITQARSRSPGGLRVPAPEIEQLVASRICQFLSEPDSILEATEQLVSDPAGQQR